MNVSILGMFNHYFIMSCRKDAYLKECPVEKANIVECLGAKLPLKKTVLTVLKNRSHPTLEKNIFVLLVASSSIFL